MSNEIKIIGNVRRPSIYDPDLAQKVIEEERLEEERRRLESKNPKPKEEEAAAKNSEIPNLAVSYNGIEFEARAYHKYRSSEKRLFHFNDSLDRIRKAGYERHARPQEVYGLIIDGLEGRLAKTPLRNVYNDMLRNFGEFISLAWERRGDMLIAYLDPEGLIWNAENRWYVKKSFNFAMNQEFNIAGKDSEQWIDLKEFDDKFVEWHYTKKFSELPKIMREESKRAQVYLPSDGSISPVVRGYYAGEFNISRYYLNGMASRGVRTKIP